MHDWSDIAPVVGLARVTRAPGDMPAGAEFVRRLPEK